LKPVFSVAQDRNPALRTKIPIIPCILFIPDLLEVRGFSVLFRVTLCVARKGLISFCHLIEGLTRPRYECVARKGLYQKASAKPVKRGGLAFLCGALWGTMTRMTGIMRYVQRSRSSLASCSSLIY
jgi:hypothetical protein